MGSGKACRRKPEPRVAATFDVPAAVELLKRNQWEGLEGLRLRSEVHYRTTYAPDLFIVDRDRHSALILDIKRSLASYSEPRLSALRRKMMAAALTAGDWLHTEGRVAGVSRVNIAIVDGSSERSDSADGIFALDEIGELIGVPDAGEAMGTLRANFARRVQSEIEASCWRAIGCDDQSPEPPAVEDGEDVDRDQTGDDEFDDRSDEDHRTSIVDRARRSMGSRSSQNNERRPIRVGFARGGSP